MAAKNRPSASAYKPLILSEDDESHPELPLSRRTSDEEPLIRQPPKPAKLKSLKKEPDPDLQLTPLKLNEPKSLLRSHAGNSKVRHRVHFQESRSFSSESEQDISNKISEVSITDDNLSHCEFTQENQNNNNVNLECNSFSDISPPNPSNCMFFDANSGVLTPQLMSVGVVREMNKSQTPSPPTLTSDFPTETDFQTERNNFANSQPYRQQDYRNRISLSDVSAETTTPRDIYFENLPKEGNGTTQKKKTPTSTLSRPSHFQVGAVSPDLYPSSSRTPSLPVDVSSVDKEPSLFGQPQLHSTLHIAQNIKTLQKKRPDLTSELKKNLENEEQRNKINEKAASKVDIRSNQDLYPGLISLDVSNFELKEATVVQRATKVKHTKKKQTTSGLEPDLLEFLTEDLQKETADFSLPGISNPAIETCKAPSLIAFDLYRHNRAWEGLPGIV